MAARTDEPALIPITATSRTTSPIPTQARRKAPPVAADRACRGRPRARGAARVVALPARSLCAAGSDWRLFIKRFLASDGRVIDNGNGDISHTEGQGYGMLLAVAFSRPPRVRSHVELDARAPQAQGRLPLQLGMDPAGRRQGCGPEQRHRRRPPPRMGAASRLRRVGGLQISAGGRPDRRLAPREASRRNPPRPPAPTRARRLPKARRHRPEPLRTSSSRAHTNSHRLPLRQMGKPSEPAVPRSSRPPRFGTWKLAPDWCSSRPPGLPSPRDTIPSLDTTPSACRSTSPGTIRIPPFSPSLHILGNPSAQKWDPATVNLETDNFGRIRRAARHGSRSQADARVRKKNTNLP